MDLKKYIRSIPDYPKKGILFRDITTLIKSPEAFNFAIDKIVAIQFENPVDFLIARIVKPTGMWYSVCIKFDNVR